MANIKQQKKRVLIAQRQRLENLRYKSTIRTMFRSLQDSVNLGDKDVASTAHKDLVRTLDRAASRKALHPNTVARKKAKAHRMLIAEPVKETKVVRRTRKKAPMRTSKKAAETTAAAKGKAKAAEAEATETTATEETAGEAPVAETPGPTEAKSDSPDAGAKGASAKDASAKGDSAKGDSAKGATAKKDSAGADDAKDDSAK